MRCAHQPMDSAAAARSACGDLGAQGGNGRMTSLFTRFLARSTAAGLLASLAASAGAQAPNLPAAPLAGGVAAMGDSYVDVHGSPIVMPASFSQPMGGACYDGGYGGGAPGSAYVDFGGYGPDQCGPYYFDIAAGVVYLTSEDAFEDVPAFASIGPVGPPILDPETLFDDYEAGWQIAARLDLGALSVLEGTYMGVYDFGFSGQVRSVDVAPGGLDDFLFSAFSNYGDPAAIQGLDNGSVYTLEYEGDLQSTELSYRRYWLGHSSRISGTYLLGFRYLRMTEELNFHAVTDAQTLNPITGSLGWDAENDLLGFQLGGDAWVCLLQGLRLGAESKAGIYNNRYRFKHAVDIVDPGVENIDFSMKDDQVAFAGEASVDLVADILPSFSIRGGYRILYLNSLVTVGNNINPADISSTDVLTQADALYHGFHGSIEYIW